MTEWRKVGESPRTMMARAASEVQPRAQVVGDIPDAHVITVRERRVTVDYPTIIQNNVNTDVIELDLDGEWDDMSVVLVLGPCGGATELAWHGEPVTLPSALAEDTGGIDVSVVGYSADGETRLVTVAAPSLLSVIKSGCTVGEAPAEETPDLIGQLVAAGDAADKAAKAANTAATAATDAAGEATRAAQSADAASEAASAAAEAARGNVLKGAIGPAPLLSADDAYATKPRKLTVNGETRQNLWSNPSGKNNGITVTSNSDGSVTVSGTTIYPNTEVSSDSFILVPGKQYTLSIDKNVEQTLSGANFLITFINASGSQISFEVARISGTTFTVPENTVKSKFKFYAGATVSSDNTQTVSGTYRVMLNEGSTAQPWCPPGLNSVGDDGSVDIVTAGKNLAGDVFAIKHNSNPYDSVMGIKTPLTPGTTYTLSFDAADGWVGYINERIAKEYTSIRQAHGRRVATVTLVDEVPADQYNDDGYLYIVKNDGDNSVAADFANIQLELGSTATDYEPPNITTTPIDLNGNTLCSLPDGTHDELTIDATGAVTLVKRTWSDVFDGTENWQDSTTRYGLNTGATFATTSDTVVSDKQMADTLPILEAVSNSNGIRTFSSRWVDASITSMLGDLAGFKAWLGNNNTTLIYKLAEPQTIPLSPVTLPTLPAPTVNVWADAEESGTGYAMDPDVELEYERDVTIAFNKLQAQISATTVREATNG